MDLSQLQYTIVDALEDVKGQDIQVFDTIHMTGMFDRVIVASGTSNRQTRALAMSVRDKVKAAGGEVISVEGLDTGEWVLVDCGDAVVHIMQPMVRSYYSLEELWGDKKLPPKPVEKKAPAKKHTAKKVAPKEAVEQSEKAEKTPTVKKTPVKKPAAKRPAAKKAAVKKAAVKKPAVKKTPAKKAVVKKASAKTPARKAPAKKAPAQKAPVKKPPAKKAAKSVK
ncbi:MAG: ribosome silencing factor [Candidatus Protistobacter heckmanni]|nr:ribosome silencing factor [Candidatus Protistobacter heckmanni]